MNLQFDYGEGGWDFEELSWGLINLHIYENKEK